MEKKIKILLIVTIFLLSINVITISTFKNLPSSYSYIILSNRSSVNAINGDTGNIDFSGDASYVFQSANSSIYKSNGQGTIFVKKGLYDFMQQVTIADGISVICEEGKSYIRGGIGDQSKACKFRAKAGIDSIFKVDGKSNIENIEFHANNQADYAIDASRSSASVGRTVFINDDFRGAKIAGMIANYNDGLYIDRAGFHNNNIGFLVNITNNGKQTCDNCVFGGNMNSDVSVSGTVSSSGLYLNDNTFSSGTNLLDAQIVLGGDTIAFFDKIWMESAKNGNFRGIIQNNNRPQLTITKGRIADGTGGTSKVPNIRGNFGRVFITDRTSIRTYNPDVKYCIDINNGIDAPSAFFFLSSACEGTANINISSLENRMIRDYKFRYYNGDVTILDDGGIIQHNLYFPPRIVMLTGSVAGEIVSVTATNSTTFTVSIKKHNGDAGTKQKIYWIAES